MDVFVYCSVLMRTVARNINASLKFLFSLSVLKSMLESIISAPLNLRPYGTIKICLLLLLFFFIPQVVKIPGVKNYKS